MTITDIAGPQSVPADAVAAARQLNDEARKHSGGVDLTDPGQREGVRAQLGKVPASPGSEDRTVPGPVGDLRLHIIRPAGPVNAVYFSVHGGGLIFGTPEMDDASNTRVARDAQVATVSPDYRLAPDSPFPAGLDDTAAALTWVLQNSGAEFGTDRVIIGGASAGTYYALLALLRVRDAGVPIDSVVGAAFSYGLFDPTFTLGERLVSDRTIGLSAAFLEANREVVFPGLRPRWGANENSPLYADLRDLPPALFTAAALDVLVDDSFFTAERWRAAGNSAVFEVWPESGHGFTAPGHPVGEYATQRINAWIRERAAGQ